MSNESRGDLSVSVAILTWNRSKSVLRALESAYSQTYKPFEVVVVDSASTDGTHDEITARFPDVKLLTLHRNLGCPEGRNFAMANCRGDIIFSLDDDAFMASDVLSLCVEKFSEDANIGVVTCKILAPNNTVTGKEADSFRAAFDGGACAIRKKAIEEAGYYPSDFFRQAEESDLALRLMDAGYKILSRPSAIVFHEPSPVNRDIKLFSYFSVRNELYTIFRLYPWHLVIPAAIQKMISWNYLGVTTSALPYTLRGTASAVGQLPRLLRARAPVSSATIHNVLTMKARARFTNS